MKLCLIIPAAGVSSRYQAAGGLRSKLDEDLGGKPLLQRTIEAFTKFDDDDVHVASIVVAGPHDDDAFAQFKERHADRLSLLGAVLCRGGKEHRWETVRAALAHPSAAPDQCTHIAVHDAARPCLSQEFLARIFRAARLHEAVIPGLRVPDTLKRVREDASVAAPRDPLGAILGEQPAPSSARVVDATVDRSGLVLAQTPQVFAARLLHDAYAKVSADASSTITDDAQLVEALGARVLVVEGDPRNLKVTTPPDVELVRRILNLKEPEGRAAHKRF